MLRSTNNGVKPTIMALRKLARGPIPKPRPKLTKEGERIIDCLMWITYPLTHILLKVSVSCTFFKDNESCHPNDDQRTKSDGETRVRDPQSCS